MNRFNDITYDKAWTEFLAAERAVGLQHVKAKAIETRFNLGLPLL